jgi:hypothetical protein
MKNPAGGDLSFEYGELQNAAGSICSDLIGLMTHLQTSIAFSERAMATFSLDDEYVAGSVYILDDVTPRYATANAALNACQAALGEALCHLLEARMSGGLTLPSSHDLSAGRPRPTEQAHAYRPT